MTVLDFLINISQRIGFFGTVKYSAIPTALIFFLTGNLR
jgi:hypothetical protein